MIVFDIETGSLPWGLLKDAIPAFDEIAAVPDPKPFDLGSVALGNLKDQAKIQQKIADARAKWELEAELLPQRRAEARNQHVAKCVEKAALSACTGMVKAIGIWLDNALPMLWFVDGKEAIDDAPEDSRLAFDNERSMIEDFWGTVEENAGESFVGHNILGFDLPFLIRRSWILGVDVPSGVRNGRYLSSQFVDLMDLWGCGTREFISLDAIDRALGGAGKPADCTGADFARLFDEGGESREKALAYLRNDLEMTRRVAETMQIL